MAMVHGKWSWPWADDFWSSGESFLELMFTTLFFVNITIQAFAYEDAIDFKCILSHFPPNLRLSFRKTIVAAAAEFFKPVSRKNPIFFP